MADRRMFAKTIVDSDAFLDMPLSTQALYFHLGMRADDDGFINNPRRVQRTIGCADDDLKLLIAKRFIIPFDSGVVVIKHWKIHNYIQSDRYKPTVYAEEKAMLTTKANKAYTMINPVETPCIQDVSSLDTECIQNVSEADTQVRLGKVSIDKSSKERKEDRKSGYEAIIEPLSEDLKDAVREFLKMRKLKRNPMTDRGLKIMLNKLRTLATDEKTQIDILNQSIEQGWASVYPLKENGYKGNFGTQNGNPALEYQRSEIPDTAFGKDFFVDLDGGADNDERTTARI